MLSLHIQLELVCCSKTPLNSHDSRGRGDSFFMCLAALLCEQFFANGDVKISIKFQCDHFFLITFSKTPKFMLLKSLIFTFTGIV